MVFAYKNADPSFIEKKLVHIQFKARVLKRKCF